MDQQGPVIKFALIRLSLLIALQQGSQVPIGRGDVARRSGGEQKASGHSRVPEKGTIEAIPDVSE